MNFFTYELYFYYYGKLIFGSAGEVLSWVSQIIDS